MISTLPPAPSILVRAEALMLFPQTPHFEIVGTLLRR